MFFSMVRLSGGLRAVDWTGVQSRVPPSNQLEALRGNRKGQHSIRINQQWRLCFRWDNGNAHDVEVTDYH